MAKNYTFTEMVKIIEAQKDLEAIAELGKRFPVLSVYVSKAVAKAPEEMKVLADCFPEHLTANKVNSIIKANLTGETSEDNSDDTDAADEKEGTEGVNLEAMTGKELKSYARKLGVFKNTKSTRKEDLIAAIKNANATAEEADEDDASEDEETNPYEGKTAMELFKLCKSRNIKAEAKKPAKYYVDLLTKADEAAKAAEESAEEDDWDEDDEEETPAPKKNSGKKSKANKNSKKASKKTAPKEDLDDEEDTDSDDEDEWDI